MKKNPQTIEDFFTKKQWDNFVKKDPYTTLLASASWQDPDNFTSNVTTIDDSFQIFKGSDEDDSKSSDYNWREIQERCWQKYKTFGPLNAAIDSKANYVFGAGFSISSNIIEIDEFIKDLFYSYRNKLYSRVISWMIRMLGEGEIFVLIVISDDGTATIRNLEPSKIGEGDNEGLLLDPDDATQTLFYEHKSSKGQELIPDARFILEPDYMKERAKALGDKLDTKLIKKSTKGIGKYKSIGGYRRFVLHWKNLTGISEYKRDTSPLSTTLEWINLYTKALKWELDYKRALCAYTIEVGFTDSPAGKVAWHVWNKMTDAQKEATNLTKPLSPGSRIFVMPGMAIKIHAPQLSSLSGSNDDLLGLANAGARTLPDMWRGDSSGSTHAAIKSTRPPFQAEIENLQYISKNFILLEFLRVCMTAKIKIGGKVKSISNKSYKLLESYKSKRKPELNHGKGKTIEVDVEPCEMVDITFPVIMLNENPQELASSSLGNKHTGTYGLGVSAETIGKKFGVQNIGKERRKQLIEIEEFGEIKSGAETKQTENDFKKKEVT